MTAQPARADHRPPDPALVKLVRALARAAAREDHAAETARQAREAAADR